MWVRSWSIIAALVTLAGLLSASSQLAGAQAITIRLEPSRIVADVGQTVQVTVRMEGAVDLGAFEFHLGYNPAVLEATDAGLGPLLTSTGRSPVPLGPALKDGEIRFAGASYGTEGGPDGAGVLAQVTFRIVGPGTSGLTFNRIIVTDSDAQVQPATAVGGLLATNERLLAFLYLPMVLNQP
jgi:hypothetical protein